MKPITLAEALDTGRLDEFIEQAEAKGVGPVSAEEFDERLARLIKAPRPAGRTSR